VDIGFGDTSVGAPHGTTYTGIDVNGGTKTRIFTFTNTTTQPITLAGGNAGFVTITGANASDFVVVRQPGQVIQPGQTATLSVRFTPHGLGFRYATISFQAADAALPFSFDIRGTGINLGRIGVTGSNGAAIVSGATNASASNGTQFGSVVAAGTVHVQRVFTITNTGIGNLVLLGTPRVTISGDATSDFTVTLVPATTTTPGGTTTFKVSFDPQALGSRVATVTILSNDPIHPNFTFVIAGTGTGTS
jgi:hypothetical protein